MHFYLALLLLALQIGGLAAGRDHYAVRLREMGAFLLTRKETLSQYKLNSKYMTWLLLDVSQLLYAFTCMLTCLSSL